MKKLACSLSLLVMFTAFQGLSAQRGYFDAPYKRYESDLAVQSNGAVATTKSFAQVDLQSEASDQICVDMISESATVEFTFSEAADGMVMAIQYLTENRQLLVFMMKIPKSPVLH